MVVARIESLIAGQSINSALERAAAYIGAGADALLIHSKDETATDLKAFCVKYPSLSETVPLVAVPTMYPRLRENELTELGVRIVIYANRLIRSAYPMMLRTARAILENGRALEADGLCMPMKEFLRLIPETRA